MHGDPALPPDYASFPYADPDAPRGGRLVLGEFGAFDSLNPFLVRGRAPWFLREYVVESLMARSRDEPFSLYGLIAESIETPEDRSWVAFRLRPEARFSTGEPITVDDVVFSLETLRDKGRPNFKSYYGQVARIERQGGRGVRFVFKKPNRELPLLLGLMPILSKKSWEGRAFGEPSLVDLVGSGPYVVDSFEAGRVIRFRRNPDHWARDLAVYAGRYNADVVEHRYFRDSATLWEAFTAGELSYYVDWDPAHWVDAYDFPAARDGRVLQREIPHGRASGMHGFVFNTRRAPLDDRRVREALALALDFAWINQRLYRGGYEPIQSFYSGSTLGFEGVADGAELATLAPFSDALPPGALEQGWRPTAGAGDGRNRRNLRRARGLLAKAGWRVSDGALRDGEGRALRFELLLGESRDERLAVIWARALKTLGVEARIRLVDQAQYADRLIDYDYDVTVRRWFLSLSPGEEQRFYWGSAGRETPGTRNYMGVASPAVDGAIDALLQATERETFEESVRALDRALSSGVYVAPFGYLKTDRVAHRRDVRIPESAPLYGFQTETVWIDSE